MDGGHVAWIFELRVKEGRQAALRALMAEMVESTRIGEPDALDYEWYLSEDGGRLHIYERYASAEAALAHLAIFGERFMPRFFDALTPERMVLYGAPDAAVRGALSQLGPAVMSQAAGFTRRGVMTS
jgi:quinol monooxygenase YgiN